MKPKKCQIVIPVNSVSIDDFCRRQDGARTRSVALEIMNFICANTPFIFPHDEQMLRHFIEVVKNIYDSFASKGLTVGASLIIDVVIDQNSMDGNKLTIKIKDNGAGFINKPSKVIFDRSQVSYQSKGNVYGYVGGDRMGLTLFERKLQDLGGKLYFKNRGKGGAVVYLAFEQLGDSEPPSNGYNLRPR